MLISALIFSLLPSQLGLKPDVEATSTSLLLPRAVPSNFAVALRTHSEVPSSVDPTRDARPSCAQLTQLWPCAGAVCAQQGARTLCECKRRHSLFLTGADACCPSRFIPELDELRREVPGSANSHGCWDWVDGALARVRGTGRVAPPSSLAVRCCLPCFTRFSGREAYVPRELCPR